ncbi:MAG: flap endonuclease-1 [Candidatus Bathyarchaeia archaeon]
MGVDLKDIVPRRQISLDELRAKPIAVDAYNALYQFLAIIRQPTGELLTDNSGRVTSHLSGILYRSSNLIEKGVNLVYVFDGKPPSLKAAEIRRRLKIKREATTKYESALVNRDFAKAKTYAQMTSHLSDSMVEDAKRLLQLLGIAVVQSPSEGEAQAAYMTKKNGVWAASQDYDSLLFGAERLVRNLTITGRRKLPRKNVYVEVNPEAIELNEVLRSLQVTRDQLIDIALLVGTDYNEGITGIGAKTALKKIRERGGLEAVLTELQELDKVNLQIRDMFRNPEVTDDYTLKWSDPDVEGVIRFLCSERAFSEERVRNAVEKMKLGAKESKSMSRLESWL